MFAGCAIFSLGTGLTYFTLEMVMAKKKSSGVLFSIMLNVKGLPWVAFTYGFISACGQGIALIPTMTIGMRWFPNQKVVIIMIVWMKTMLMNDD